MKLIQVILLFVISFQFLACSSEEEMRFRKIPTSHSGVSFKNRLHESVEFNIFNYMYFYNGGGVAVGDLNGDGLQDIYFTSNQEANKLYINKGDFRFEDKTDIAGVEGLNGWATGVVFADVNADNKLDIYVSYVGKHAIYNGRNQLFINQGNDESGVPKFTDKSMEFGLDLVGFSTQAAFFDYDRDGDLDMFMLNHSLHDNGTFGNSELRKVHHDLAGDRLLKNENGRFVDVTSTSGIYSSVLGYGLGIVISDVNLDGWPDIYVGNDFHENDYLYINQGDGTFKEDLQNQMMHTSRYTMGVDFADFNNDAFPDLIAMDMLPEDPLILKSSGAEDEYDVYNFKINFGYNHQFTRNTLQVNNGNNTFSEIALLSNVAATDWSWSTLMADFDLDGYKDIFVSNGILRRSNDLDYMNFITVDSIQMKMKDALDDKNLAYIEKMPKIKIANYVFRNNGDLTFTNKANEWGLNTPSYSNGAAYSDLDNDGDLDLVINNVEDEAFVYENMTLGKNRNLELDTAVSYLQVKLNGIGGNLMGVGAKVFIYQRSKIQMQECYPVRGFQSSVDNRLVFGVANFAIDSVVVIWNTGEFETIKNVSPNQQMTLNQSEASGVYNYNKFHQFKKYFSKSDLQIDFVHQENKFVEFNREPLIPHMFSSEGPAVAIADLNSDGLSDIFLGNGKWKESQLFIQGARGKFVKWEVPVIADDSVAEDVFAVFFDADQDSDNDLLVVPGGNEFSGKSPYTKPRLYLNENGKGFIQSNGIPEIHLTGSCVAVNDIDFDGDLDIFIGARTTPWQYGVAPDSYLLVNNGKGEFEDATKKSAPMLRKFGFVKSAIWADMDGDKIKDLVLALEWSPIKILLNKNGRLVEFASEGSGLERAFGWWNTIEAADMDSDGDLDLIAGNLGLNSKLKATETQPVSMYVGDFDKNDSIDQVLTHYMQGIEYPFNTRDELTKQMPFLKKRFLSYRKFAETTAEAMFSKEALEKATKYKATYFKSVYIENLGSGKFEVNALPIESQFSTINAILVEDFNNDANLDLFVAGNFYPINVQMGRNDASFGLLLLGDGKGNFSPVINSGVVIKGEVRHLNKVIIGKQVHYLAVRNNDTVESFVRSE